MQDYENKLVETIFYKPSLIEELIIPIECIKDNTNRELLIEINKDFQQNKKIDATSLLMRLQRENKKELSNKVLFLIENSNFGDVVHFDLFQEELFKNYQNDLLVNNANMFATKKIDLETYISNVHTIEEKSIKTKDGKKTASEIKSLLTDSSKKINFRYPKLSKALELHEHDLTIVSARTGVGKSGFMLNLLESLSHKYKCVLFNMEMSEEGVYKRLLGIISGIPMNELNDPRNASKLNEAIEDLASRNIKIYTCGQTLQSIRRKIIEECKDEHTIVFIDYIGLMGNTDKYKSLYELVTANTKALRSISMSYDCTIIGLAQLNRGTEDRSNGPQLSDLKESGELEQSAVSVLLLFGEESEYGNTQQRITIRIAKNRNGGKGDKDFMYFKDTQQFEEILDI